MPAGQLLRQLRLKANFDDMDAIAAIDVNFPPEGVVTAPVPVSVLAPLAAEPTKSWFPNENFNVSVTYPQAAPEPSEPPAPAK